MKDTDSKLFIVGYSKGANTLLKYLGETGMEGNTPVQIGGAISLCNPLIINYSELKLPWSHVLRWGAKKQIIKHSPKLRKMSDLHFQSAMRDAVYSSSLSNLSISTAPYLIRNSSESPFETKIGYSNQEEYWNDASSQAYVPHIAIPFLICFSKDDDIANCATSAVFGKCLANPNCIVVSTESGGHIGWHCVNNNNIVTSWNFKSNIMKNKSWDNRIVVEFIASSLNHQFREMHANNRKNISSYVSEHYFISGL